MPSIVIRWSLPVIALICLLQLALIAANRDLSFLGAIFQEEQLQSFKIMFLSIILEAMPFILIGVILSALLQVFVSEHMIQRFIPKNPFLGILYACIIGILFPICECGMIPVMRRLLRKGMPLYIAIVFIIAGPILNPVVFASTFMAFRSRPEMAYSRMGLAFLTAVIIGLIVYRFVRLSPLRSRHDHHVINQHTHDHHSHGYHSHDHHAHDHHHTNDHGGKWHTVLTHTTEEFFEMGKYLIFGSFLAALIQTVLTRDWLTAIGTGEYSSHLFMMGFAYLVSLCSTSDAFVASSFASTFTSGSLLSFLVFGPMLDVKATLMLSAVFRGRFVLTLSMLIASIVFLLSVAYERLF